MATNWNKVFSSNSFSIEFEDFDSMVTPAFVKEIRNRFNFSQRLFVKILGVSEKTIEKWEQGANPVKGTSSRLLFLLNKHDHLINDLYSINHSDNDESQG